MTRAIIPLIVFIIAAGIYVGFKHDSKTPPVCTSGTSSIQADGTIVTIWYPKGCRHG